MADIVGDIGTRKPLTQRQGTMNEFDIELVDGQAAPLDIRNWEIYGWVNYRPSKMQRIEQFNVNRTGINKFTFYLTVEQLEDLIDKTGQTTDSLDYEYVLFYKDASTQIPKCLYYGPLTVVLGGADG